MRLDIAESLLVEDTRLSGRAVGQVVVGEWGGWPVALRAMTSARLDSVALGMTEVE